MAAESIPDRYYETALRAFADRDLCRGLIEVESAQGPRIRRDGRELLCFCGNNYLGLADDARLVSAAKAALDEFGVGAGASRLVSGSMTPHHQLEARLAAFKNTPAALSFSTGYQANLAAVRAGAGKGDLICSDELNHASIVDACRLSRAEVRVFRHTDYDELESILRTASTFGRRLIVTDSVFSVDGDFADLVRLADLKDKYEASLCVDEAHATGVYGQHGRGLAEMLGAESAVDISVGTFSKALGVLGGYVAGSKPLIDYLIATGRSFVYSTAPPPALAAAVMAALDLVEAEPDRRRRLLAKAAHVRTTLGDQWGLNIGRTRSPIIPLIVGEARSALRLSEHLLNNEILAPAIRPPTVPEGTARLRITMMATHTDEDIEALLTAIRTGIDATTDSHPPVSGTTA